MHDEWTRPGRRTGNFGFRTRWTANPVRSPFFFRTSRDFSSFLPFILFSSFSYFLFFLSFLLLLLLFYVFWKWRPRSGKILKDVYLLCFRCCHLGGRPSPVVYPSKSVPTNLTDWLCTVVAELIRGYVNFVRYIYFPSLKFYCPIIIFVSLKNCTGQKIRGNFINIFKNWET